MTTATTSQYPFTFVIPYGDNDSDMVAAMTRFMFSHSQLG